MRTRHRLTGRDASLGEGKEKGVSEAEITEQEELVYVNHPLKGQLLESRTLQQ